MSFLDTVHRVIDLAREVSQFNETELPKYYRNYPFISPGEDNPPRPPAQADLKKSLEALPDDQIFVLLALMYIGRGEESADHMDDLLERLKQDAPSRGSIVSSLIAMGPLAEYLADGLAHAMTKGANFDEWSHVGAPTPR